MKIQIQWLAFPLTAAVLDHIESRLHESVRLATLAPGGAIIGPGG